MSVTDMAPAPPHSHQPLVLLYHLSYRLPVTMVRKMGLPTTRMPLPWEFRRAKAEKRILGMLVFRVLHRAVRCLWAMLSKAVERCGAVMEVLHSATPPALAGKGLALGLLVESGGLGPGGGTRGQGREPADQEWDWHLDLKVLDEEVEVLDEEDEEEVMAPNMKTMKVDTVQGQKVELELCWLEWQSEDEELPSDRADSAPEPFLLLVPAGRGQNTPTGPSLNSEEEQEEEEHSESDWSEDEEDDWDESDESSEVDSELWESFLCSSDPLNPFRLSSTPEKKGRVPETDEFSGARPLRIAEGESTQVNPPQTGRKTGKKVRFSEEVVVRPMVVWAFASRAARDGSCWLEMARDRDRFRRRVQMASDIISPVLQANHRASMWERYQLT